MSLILLLNRKKYIHVLICNLDQINVQFSKVVKELHKMHDARNNCFGTLLLFYSSRACFRLIKGRIMSFLLPKTIVASLLHLMMLICEVFIKQFSKLQLVVVPFAVFNSNENSSKKLVLIYYKLATYSGFARSGADYVGAWGPESPPPKILVICILDT